MESVGSPRVGGECTVSVLSCGTRYMLLLKKFLLRCFHKHDALMSPFHSRGCDKIQQLHQLPAVPQRETN